MSTGTKHSPTPWRSEILPASDPRNPFTSPMRLTLDANGGEVNCDSCEGGDWRFAIHAANCHDDLLEALEAILPWIEPYKTGLLFKEVPQAIAAIAKAKGEPK